MMAGYDQAVNWMEKNRQELGSEVAYTGFTTVARD
jgi:hypothetical protein